MDPSSTAPEHAEALNLLPELDTLYQSMEERKAEMLTRLGALTDGERRRRPVPSQWSPLQVMEHVVMVEEWLADPNAAPLPPDARVLMKGRLFITLGGGLMRSGLRTPTVPAAEPRGDLDFAAIKRRWDAARTTLASTLSAVTRETRPLPIALHPIAGPLDARRVLALLDVHLAYHWRHFPRAK